MGVGDGVGVGREGSVYSIYTIAGGALLGRNEHVCLRYVEKYGISVHVTKALMHGPQHLSPSHS